jgi:hypothetical protein
MEASYHIYIVLFRMFVVSLVYLFTAGLDVYFLDFFDSNDFLLQVSFLVNFAYLTCI